MLVLSRRRQEAIRIGEDVYITVLEIDGGKVRLGITAPLSVEVMRVELDRRPAPPAKGVDDAGS
jgi:carbon storage regulator